MIFGIAWVFSGFVFPTAMALVLTTIGVYSFNFGLEWTFRDTRDWMDDDDYDDDNYDDDGNYKG